MPGWLADFYPIALLLVAVAFVMWRLPKIELGHSDAYRARRLRNWLPLGLIYAFLYMGRYNLAVAKDAFGSEIMDNHAFGLIFGAGALTYGFSFIINGPLADRLGGRKTILIGGAGAALMNLLMGLVTFSGYTEHFVPVFAFLYAFNMYFQSFGAVSIVKVNAPWFHVKERGVFGAIFGILISLGIYFAFDWGYMIVNAFPTEWVFFVPAAIIAVMWVAVFVLVRDVPSQAGFDDFHTGDATAGDTGPRLAAPTVFRLMLANSVIMTIAAIEFCSGFLRQAVMQWYRTFAKQTGAMDSFVYENWGMLLCVAGILGGVIAGIISDRVFGARRGPVAAILYLGLFFGGVGLIFFYDSVAIGALVIFMSLCVIGVHGMLSGTASMDFGGSRNVGVAVGIIDGFVYAGTGVMALTYSYILPNGEAAKDAANWLPWPVAMVPVAVIGLFLASRIWNAKPIPKATAD